MTKLPETDMFWLDGYPLTNNHWDPVDQNSRANLSGCSYTRGWVRAESWYGNPCDTITIYVICQMRLTCKYKCHIKF